MRFRRLASVGAAVLLAACTSDGGPTESTSVLTAEVQRAVTAAIQDEFHAEETYLRVLMDVGQVLPVLQRGLCRTATLGVARGSPPEARAARTSKCVERRQCPALYVRRGSLPGRRRGLSSRTLRCTMSCSRSTCRQTCGRYS